MSNIASKVLEAYESGRYRWRQGSGRAGNDCACPYIVATDLNRKNPQGGEPLARMLGFRYSQELWRWNDAPSTTYAMVLARLREAAAREARP